MIPKLPPEQLKDSGLQISGSSSSGEYLTQVQHISASESKFYDGQTYYQHDNSPFYTLSGLVPV